MPNLRTYFQHALEQAYGIRVEDMNDKITISVKNLMDIQTLAVATEQMARYDSKPIEDVKSYECSFNSELFMGIGVRIILESYNEEFDLPYEFKVYLITNSVRVYIFSVYHSTDTLDHDTVISIGGRVNNYVDNVLKELRYMISIVTKYQKENKKSNIEL